MIRLEGSVTFADGRRETITVGQFEFAAWERYALRHGLGVKAEDAPPITLLRYLGYAALQKVSGRLQPDWPDFEEWGATVDEVELDTEPGETAVVPPTLTGVSAE